MLVRLDLKNTFFSIVRNSKFGSNSTRTSLKQLQKAYSQICVRCAGIRMLASFVCENNSSDCYFSILS